MLVIASRQFKKDLKAVANNQELVLRIADTVEQMELAESLRDVVGINSIQNSDGYYRIRIGAYRLGVFHDKGQVTLLRFLHRSKIYKVFP